MLTRVVKQKAVHSASGYGIVRPFTQSPQFALLVVEHLGYKNENKIDSGSMIKGFFLALHPK